MKKRWKSSIIGSWIEFFAFLPFVMRRRREHRLHVREKLTMKTELIIEKMLWHIKTWHTQSTMRVAKALTFREMTSGEKIARARERTGQTLIEVIVS